MAATVVPAAEKGRDHWAFQPIKKPSLPLVKNQAWVKTPIDQFILARLEKAGLQPARAAAPRDLRRRIHYALTGLPPSPTSLRTILRSSCATACPRPPSRPTDPKRVRGWLIHHVNLGIALKEKTDALNVESHLKYPGAKTKYQSQVEFFVDKLLDKQSPPSLSPLHPPDRHR